MYRFGFNTSLLPVLLPFSTNTPGQPLQFPPHVHPPTHGLDNVNLSSFKLGGGQPYLNLFKPIPILEAEGVIGLINRF